MESNESLEFQLHETDENALNVNKTGHINYIQRRSVFGRTVT